MTTVRLTGKQFAIFLGVFSVYASAIAGIHAYTAKKNRDNYEDAMWAIEKNANNVNKTFLDRLNYGTIK